MAGALFGAPNPTPLTAVPPQSSAGGVSRMAGMNVEPHHGLICVVAIAVALVLVLDRAGFRFAVTAGRR